MADTVKTKRIFIAFDGCMSEALRGARVSGIRELLYRVDYDVTELGYLLNCGDVSEAPFSNDRVYAEMLHANVWDSYESTWRTLERLRGQRDCDFEVFVNSVSDNELCNLYYFSSELSRLGRVYLNYCTVEMRGGSLAGQYYTVTKRTELTAELSAALTARWSRLSRSNAAVRGVSCGEIVEYPVSAAKDAVRSVITGRYRLCTYLYAAFLDSLDEGEHWSGTSFEYVLRELESDGVIESIADKDVPERCADICFARKYKLSAIK